jgi:hypothetical protein
LHEAWRIAQFGASIASDAVVAGKLLDGIRASGSIANLARMIVRGEVSGDTIASIAGGILGLQTRIRE